MEPALGATQNAGSKKKKALDKSESFGACDTERERRESGTWVDKFNRVYAVIFCLSASLLLIFSLTLEQGQARKSGFAALPHSSAMSCSATGDRNQ